MRRRIKLTCGCCGVGMWRVHQKLQLGMSLQDETAPLLDNPLCNGVLLCDVLAALEGSKVLQEVRMFPEYSLNIP